MDKVAIQKKIAKKKDVNCHFDKTHIIAHYDDKWGVAKRRYHSIKDFVNDIKNTVDVEIESAETKIGKNKRDRKFVVKIKM